MLDSVRSIGRRRLEPRNVGEDASLIRHLPYVTALEDDVLMLRDGELMATLTVDGVGANTADSRRVEDIADAVQSVLAQSMPDLGFCLHRLSVLAEPKLPLPLQADAFSFEVDRRWQQALSTMALRERRSFLTVTLRPPVLAGVGARLFGAGAGAERTRITRRIARLEEVVGFLAETLHPIRPERLTVSDGRWLGLLRALVTGRYDPLPLPPTFLPIADLVAASTVRFDGDQFLVSGSSTEDMRFGAVFAVKA